MEPNVFLNEVHIQNFLSLHNVRLPLKRLTVLVGPNASGKSNVLKALALLAEMMIAENPPPAEYIQTRLWAGGADKISFQLIAKADNKIANYQLTLQPQPKYRIFSEELVVNTVKVISIQKGKGQVRDENDKNPISFNSTKLALKSAGDYGDKPITSALTNFIRAWEFYDFKPDKMRGKEIEVFLTAVVADMPEPERLDNEGASLRYFLSSWHKKDPERFQVVNQALKTCIRLGIESHENGKEELFLLEGYKTPIPLDRASDGTLRLLAYHVLLNQPEPPSLIAIEEPERNLHPGGINEIGRILEQLADRTQVIITTHSSQLLDSLNADNLSDSLGVLLLRNNPGIGTEVISLDEVRADRKALASWIEEFGIGSAIFDSQLLQDITEG